MPKSIVQANKELKEYRESLGLVLVQLWVSPKKREQLMQDYPLPTRTEPAKDYLA